MLQDIKKTLWSAADKLQAMSFSPDSELTG